MPYIPDGCSVYVQWKTYKRFLFNHNFFVIKRAWRWQIWYCYSGIYESLAHQPHMTTVGHINLWPSTYRLGHGHFQSPRVSGFSRFRSPSNPTNTSALKRLGVISAIIYEVTCWGSKSHYVHFFLQRIRPTSICQTDGGTSYQKDYPCLIRDTR